MRDEAHYRKMLAKNPNASIGFTLAACMIYAAIYGQCVRMRRRSRALPFGHNSGTVRIEAKKGRR